MQPVPAAASVLRRRCVSAIESFEVFMGHMGHSRGKPLESNGKAVTHSPPSMGHMGDKAALQLSGKR